MGLIINAFWFWLQKNLKPLQNLGTINFLTNTMFQNLKRIVLSSSILSHIAISLRKMQLKRKNDISYGKNVFIGYSVICEGKNNFAPNSSITSSYIGFGSYIAEGTRIAKTKIGKFCSIGQNVYCIFGKHPSNTFVSTHPAFFSTRNSVAVSYTENQLFQEFATPIDKDGKYSIIIGNDVWIGANVSIMDGVVIGDGAIIAANALVNKDVEPYSIVGGVPSKLIKYRFSKSQIEFLKKFKWWNKSEEWIRNNADYFSDIEKFSKVHSDG